MKSKQLDFLPEQEPFKNLHIGVVGDFALDVYFNRNTETGEISIETSKAVWHGNKIRTSPGGAGNVVNNLKALGVGRVSCFGITGNDVWGRELRYLLEGPQVYISGIIQTDDWETCTYVKPFSHGEEQNRIDFGHNHKISDEARKNILSKLEYELPFLNALIINQQFITPLVNPDFLEQLLQLLQKFPDCYALADLRDFGGLCRGVDLKVNLDEMIRLLNGNTDPESKVSSIDIDQEARKLVDKIDGSLLLTRGEGGITYISKKEESHIEALKYKGPVDTVGAGDTVVAAFTAAMSKGLEIKSALKLGMLAASVTIQKIGITGTASLQEIRQLLLSMENPFENPDSPIGSEIEKTEKEERLSVEWIGEKPESGKLKNIKGVMLDHDGTLSLLRSGWQKIMLEFLMSTSKGSGLTPDAEVMGQLNNFIDKTTGLPTVEQMEIFQSWLKDEHGIDTSDKTDPGELKKTFVDLLSVNINLRIESIHSGENSPEDYLVPGSISLLEFLNRRELLMHLASGTDEKEVVKESRLLGYYHFFEENIWGARGRDWEAKSATLNKWLEDGVKAEEILVIGDGPTEVRAGKKIGAFCLGVAIDESNPREIDHRKRNALIKAEADGIIYDYLGLIEELDNLLG